MYPEFIAIYVGLGVLFVLVIIILVMLFVIMSKIGKLSVRKPSYYGTASASAMENLGVVFCKKCAAQFDAGEKFCPKCGTPR